ncbi:unnamed protein product [Protopolystoma xenopodis]|uniref:Uncharacterized protein n=1 Tax=Protopolystoma xenopodis TaxID=117903 RepID=A0A3S5AMY8_9PLAT|nr:unnamed protein product [Protopolystoma xenopodis]
MAYHGISPQIFASTASQTSSSVVRDTPGHSHPVPFAAAGSSGCSRGSSSPESQTETETSLLKTTRAERQEASVQTAAAGDRSSSRIAVAVSAPNSPLKRAAGSLLGGTSAPKMERLVADATTSSSQLFDHFLDQAKPLAPTKPINSYRQYEIELNPHHRLQSQSSLSNPPTQLLQSQSPSSRESLPSSHTSENSSTLFNVTRKTSYSTSEDKEDIISHNETCRSNCTRTNCNNGSANDSIAAVLTYNSIQSFQSPVQSIDQMPVSSGNPQGCSCEGYAGASCGPDAPTSNSHDFISPNSVNNTCWPDRDCNHFAYAQSTPATSLPTQDQLQMQQQEQKQISCSLLHHHNTHPHQQTTPYHRQQRRQSDPLEMQQQQQHHDYLQAPHRHDIFSAKDVGRMHMGQKSLSLSTQASSSSSVSPLQTHPPTLQGPFSCRFPHSLSSPGPVCLLNLSSAQISIGRTHDVFPDNTGYSSPGIVPDVCQSPLPEDVEDPGRPSFLTLSHNRTAHFNNSIHATVNADRVAGLADSAVNTGGLLETLDPDFSILSH